MPRPVSWLPRLHQITRIVTNSVRSHYDRRDLEKLFELQPRAAQELLKMLPSVQVGTSRLVDREILADFLNRVRDADDVSALFEQVRTEKVAVAKKRVHSLVRRDLAPVAIASLPKLIALTPGRLEVTFETVEQLAESMLMLARVLENEGDEFARLFEVESSGEKG